MCGDMRKSSFLKPYADPPGLRNPLQTVSSMLGMMPIMILFMKYGRKTCKEYFNSMRFKNPVLLSFLEQIYGERDFSALAFLMMFAWFNQKNAGYLIGGSRPMAVRMTDKYLSLGGKLTTGKRVDSVIVENDCAKGIVLSDGTTINADYVISAADGYSTIFRMLNGKYTSKKIVDAYNKWELFTPIVQVSFGINKELMTDIPNESFLFKDQKIGKTVTKQGYSLMNYSFDKTMAPEGKTVIVMRFESPWELWDKMDKNEYKSEKENIEKDARQVIEKHYPGVGEYIEAVDVATPLTDVRYTGVWKGSYEGFLPSSKNLMDNLNPVLPRLKKFYMAGQWLFPGGGLPPAGQSGKWAIQYICREEKMKFTVS
jgi:phytoene dehydrogenase-like protein